MWSIQMVVNDFYAITLGHLGEHSDAPEILTCSIKMVVGIVSYYHIRLSQCPVMSESCIPAGSSCSGQ